MWGNRWGSLTGLRVDKKEFSESELAVQLRQNLNADDAGLILHGLRADANEAVESPVDFGQLFMGFSFFVIAAVLAITGMLFTFSMEQRSRQIGLLRALGWKSRIIKFVFWSEGLFSWANRICYWGVSCIILWKGNSSVACRRMEWGGLGSKF
jgi:hypothetical protein